LPVFGGRPQQASTGGQDGLGRDVPLWLEHSGVLLYVLAIEIGPLISSKENAKLTLLAA
jgi:hypothetical protein